MNLRTRVPFFSYAPTTCHSFSKSPGTRAAHRGRPLSSWLASHWPTDTNRLFHELFSGFPAPSTLAESVEANGTFFPSLTIDEDESTISVTLEVPGMSEEDLDIELESDHVILRGEKKLEEKGEKDGQIYSESRYGKFERVVELQSDIDVDKVDASLRNGVLTLILPKTSPVEPTRKKVSVRAG